MALKFKTKNPQGIAIPLLQVNQYKKKSKCLSHFTYICLYCQSLLNYIPPDGSLDFIQNQKGKLKSRNSFVGKNNLEVNTKKCSKKAAIFLGKAKIMESSFGRY